MIGRAPLAQNSYICSSCRSRLLRQIPLRKKLRNVDQFRPFLTQQRKLQQISGDHEHDALKVRETQIIPRAHDKHLRSSIRHLNLREDRISLPIKSLGEPATIRILRERPHVPKEEVRDGPIEGESLEEFLKDVTTREGPSSNDEAIENIEQLRTIFLERVGRSVEPSLEDCQVLGQSLQDGFTARHLEAYIEVKRKSTTSVPDDLEALYMGDSYSRSRWFVGDTDFPDERRLEPVYAMKLRDQSYIMPTYYDTNWNPHQNRKARMAEEIMRQCWCLRTYQERKLPGSVDIKIDVNVLDLLLTRNQKLRTISKTYGIKIDVAPTLGIIRINGLYEVCDLALQAVVDHVQSVRVDTIRMESGVQATKRKAISLWDSIEQMTGTKIIPRSQELVDVLYLTPENLDDTRRLIAQVAEHYQQKRPDIQRFPPEIVPVLVPVEVGSSLGFVAQPEKWFRWRTGEYGLKKGGTLEQLTMPASQSLIIKDLAERFRTVWAAGESDHWDTEPKQLIQARFGSIVHSVEKLTWLEAELNEMADDPELRANNINETFNKLRRFRRAFVGKVPNVVAAMNELAKDQPTLTNSILITLKPEIEFHPLLELEISVNNGEQTTRLARADLVHDTRVVDLLLPVHPVDVRFASRTLFTAKPANFDPAILTFLSNSNLDVWGKDRLRTPQALVLDLPTSGREKKVEENIQAKYSFSSLSVCSDLRGSFQSFPLTLSTVEAGKSGGHREELQLEFHARSDKNVIDMDYGFEKEIPDFWAVEFMMWYGAIKEVVSRIPD